MSDTTQGAIVMKNKLVYLILICVAVVLVSVPSFAQNTNKLTYYFGVGLTQPAQYTSNRLDTGFHFAGGGGYNFSSRIGILGEFGYYQLGVSSTELNALGVPNGSMRVYSLTANPIVHLNPKGRFDAYAIGGGGFYRRTVEFTEPSIATVRAFDPFLGVFFPMGISVNSVVGSFTQNKGGLNIGGGMTVRLRGDSGTKVFVETRYHHAFTTPKGTNVIPVTFGLRW
jgi:opacity protein-like surface antigen